MYIFIAFLFMRHIAITTVSCKWYITCDFVSSIFESHDDRSNFIATILLLLHYYCAVLICIGKWASYL